MSQTAEAHAPRSRSLPAPRVLLEKATGLGLVAILGLWLVVQLVRTPERFAGALVEGVNVGAIYALIALGYTLVYGIIELINFSHGDLFMLSTVLGAFVVITVFGATSPTLGGFGVLALGLVVTMTLAATVNVAAERLAYRRLRKAPKLAPLITAVGLSFVYQWGGVRTNGSGQKTWDSLLGDSGFTVAGISVPWSMVLVTGVTIPLLMLMMWIVQNTRQGKAMRATAQDQDAARLMGIDVDRTIAFTFAVGGALAGAAGVLYLQTVENTRWDAGFRLGLYAFTAAVLGGIGRLDGAVLGGFLIGIIQNLNDSGMLPFGQKWSQTVVFTILIMLMVFRPEGLLGRPTTEKV
ncbi:MAG: branched-chain amino acid transport system permease protein [Actinomycetota bacterium]|nr:branched-chain amino acid transport system permease protein [Actinomycetota bacterium]